ncbi:MAG: hypothetical protein HQ475_13535 [SAR202 cluster bacterium]|nr:hypothetical protein [SAR202 cluster bacterium]
MGLVTLPISIVLKLVRLPLTIIGCVTKLGCALVIVGLPAGILVLYLYLT